MNMKTLIATTLGLASISGLAHADGAPFLHGDYSVNILESYNADVRILPQTRTAHSSPVFGYSARNVTSPAVAGPDTLSPASNYAPNVRMEDIRGK